MNAQVRFLMMGQKKRQFPLVAAGAILILFGFACYWAASGSLTLSRTAGRAGFDRVRVTHVDAVADTGGEHLTIAQTAALALIEGGHAQKPRRTFRPIYDPKAHAASRLVSKLQTGTDAEAAEAIRGLASLGGERSIERLADVMNDAGWSTALRTEAALAMLKSGNEQDALAAIRGLGAIGGDANTDKLASMVHDPSLPQTKRLAAALGLGTIGTTRAGDYLISAFSVFSDPEIHAQLLDTLGHLPFPQIEEMWTEYLDAPDTPALLRSAAVEALANSSQEAAPFLLKMTRSDHDPEVREVAAWALSAHGTNGELGADLADLVHREPEADVRRRIYEALPAQAENPAASLLTVIQAETDIAARVAGFNAIGDAVRRSAPRTIAGLFDAQIVPELTQIALSSESLNIRMRAVFALRRAGTPAAVRALGQISSTESPPIAQAALNGLPTTTRTP